MAVRKKRTAGRGRVRARPAPATPERGSNHMDIVGNVIRLVTFALFLIYGWEFMQEFFTEEQAINTNSGIAALVFLGVYSACDDIVRILKALARK